MSISASIDTSEHRCEQAFSTNMLRKCKIKRRHVLLIHCTCAATHYLGMLNSYLIATVSFNSFSAPLLLLLLSFIFCGFVSLSSLLILYKLVSSFKSKSKTTKLQVSGQQNIANSLEQMMQYLLLAWSKQLDWLFDTWAQRLLMRPSAYFLASFNLR